MLVRTLACSHARSLAGTHTRLHACTHGARTAGGLGAAPHRLGEQEQDSESSLRGRVQGEQEQESRRICTQRAGAGEQEKWRTGSRRRRAGEVGPRRIEPEQEQAITCLQTRNT